jgi:hypothetical protein
MTRPKAIVLPVLAGANAPRSRDIGERILQLMTAEGVREAFSVLYKGAGEQQPVQPRQGGRPRHAPAILRLVSHSAQIVLYYFPDAERGWLVVKPNRLPLSTIEERVSRYLHFGLNALESGTLVGEDAISVVETAGLIKAIAA